MLPVNQPKQEEHSPISYPYKISIDYVDIDGTMHVTKLTVNTRDLREAFIHAHTQFWVENKHRCKFITMMSLQLEEGKF